MVVQAVCCVQGLPLGGKGHLRQLLQEMWLHGLTGHISAQSDPSPGVRLDVGLQDDSEPAVSGWVQCLPLYSQESH